HSGEEGERGPADEHEEQEGGGQGQDGGQPSARQGGLLGRAAGGGEAVVPVRAGLGGELGVVGGEAGVESVGQQLVVEERGRRGEGEGVPQCVGGGEGRSGAVAVRARPQVAGDAFAPR